MVALQLLVLVMFPISLVCPQSGHSKLISERLAFRQLWIFAPISNHAIADTN
jgi:hypothetical protein